MGRIKYEKTISGESVGVTMIKLPEKIRNIDLAESVHCALGCLGVKDIIVCAGARNTVLIETLLLHQFNLHSFFEERSAAFFALGRMKKTGSPVAIITTSGTAVAELLPAVIEAYYQNQPLIVITADRPKSYRHKGAPQSIEQAGLFNHYVSSFVDWDCYQKDFNLFFDRKKPFQFNVCFDEPLIDGAIDTAKNYFHRENLFYPEILSKEKTKEISLSHAFAIVSECPEQFKKSIIDFLVKNKIPHFAEALSGLKGHTSLETLQICNLDAFKNIDTIYGIKNIIRIGHVPTHRLWRDLENLYKHIPVFHIVDSKFTGLSRSSVLLSYEDLDSINCDNDTHFLAAFKNRDNDIEIKLKKSLLKHSSSEPSAITSLSNLIGNDPVYIGNSLPIRQWDAFSRVHQLHQWVYANRGANGIDGQLSTYMGWSKDFEISWCVLGDLTALYDLAALGLCALSNHRKRLVIINNGGGQIFDRVVKTESQKKIYINSHAVQFEYWAKMWGWDFKKIDMNSEQAKKDLDSLENHSSVSLVIELVIDHSRSQAFWSDWESICKS